MKRRIHQFGCFKNAIMIGNHLPRLLLFIFLFSLSFNINAQFFNVFDLQNTAVPYPGTTVTNSASSVKWILNTEHVSPWETIQTAELRQTGDQPLPPVKLNLDQVRNGSADAPVASTIAAPWVNGNAGASNAHYAEGWSIPYRCVIENLAAGDHSIDIEWDVRQSNSSAIDFVTNYDVLDYPAGSHVSNFGHNKEMINPIVEAGSWVQGTSTEIPTPDFTGAPSPAVSNYYTAIMGTGVGLDAVNKFSVWNATITGMSYVSQGNVTVAASSTRLRIFFTSIVAPGEPTATVIISWGGHIAKGEGVWGEGNSAAAVSGSPYHTRLIEWDPDGAGPGDPASIGNQDRSLSADAVLDPPLCSIQGPNALSCNATSTFTSGVSASDLSQGMTFEWSLPVNNCGASLSSPTVSSVVVNPGSGCNCTFTLRYVILKNNLEVSRCNFEVTVNDNVAPTITCPTVSQTPLACPATPTFGNATATDNCGTPTLTSSDVTTPGNCAGNYTVTRTWTATDACGNTSTCSRSITVQDVTAPTIEGVGGPSSISCPATPTFSSPTATDACSTPTITSSDANTPGTCTNNYSVTRTWTATDECGNTSTASQTITVTDNTPPVISGVGGSSTISCPSTPSFSSPTASDACGEGTFTPTYSDANTPGTCANNYSVTRTWTATDACGNTSTASQTITVEDNTPPVISGVGGPSTISCPSTPSFSNPTASDACGEGTFTPTYSDATTPGTCPNNYSVTRTWTATDACGNTATASQTITVEDNTAPVITCPADATVDCEASTSAGALASATATDACGSTTVSSADETTTRDCVKLITRTWTATDACGNTATCVQYIIQKDLTAPVITCNPDGSATASDNCTATNDIILYLSNGTWTAIDASGNISTESCPVLGSRLNNSQTLAEDKVEQTPAPGEEKTAAPARREPLIQDIAVRAIPNPFNDRVKFVVTVPRSGYGSLEVMNMLGQKVKTVFNGQLSAGTQSFEMVLPQSRYATLFYILRTEGKQVSGKLVQMN